MNNRLLPTGRTKLIATIVHYKLLIFGLLFVFSANLFDASIFKVDIDETIANLGVLFFMVGAVQWLFEATMRQQLYEEITNLTIKNIRIVTSGIMDVVENSKTVNYSQEIQCSKRLIIGLNYSPRILEDNIHEFHERVNRKLETTFVILNYASEAGKFLSLNKDENGHIKPNIEKLKRIVHELESNPRLVNIRYHSSVLRYSFVWTDSFIWIKPHPNSNGRTRVPALQFKIDSPLYSYFCQDIENLLKQTSNHDQ